MKFKEAATDIRSIVLNVFGTYLIINVFSLRDLCVILFCKIKQFGFSC